MFKKLTFYLIILSSSFVFAQEEVVVVTGSYIKGSPTDGASPVEIYDRELIENIGAMNVADITANMVVDSGSENNADSFTSGATQGRTNVNLRGLGLTSTLVLIDGRRQTFAGAVANDGSVFVDTSVIPVIALDRVEVLKEGAASVYGSDAVAGVVNYIFRRDFTGFEVDISREQKDLTASSRDDRISFIYGGEFGNTNAVIAYSTLDRSPMSGTAKDLAPLGISTLGRSFRYIDLDGDPTTDPTVTAAAGPWAGTYGDTNTATGGNIPDPNCVANGGMLIAGGVICGFYYGPRFNIVNEENHEQIYTSITTAMDSGIEFNLDVLISETRVWDNPQSPSYPALSYLSPTMLIQPGTGGSPFDQPVLWLGRPLGADQPSPLAPRVVDTTRISTGLTGTFENGFDWDFRITSSVEDAYGLQPDTGTTALQAAIDNNTFDLFVPQNNTQAVIDSLASNQETWTEVKLDVLDFVTTGEIGNVQIATGIQLREESIDIDRSANSIVTFDANGNLLQAADMIFLGGGIEVDESKTSEAIFVEAAMDISDNLELRGAIRYENLEVDSTVDPKISLRYQATDDLVIRASASSSFRDPTLAQLYASSVGLEGIQDYNAQGAAVGTTAFIRIAAKADPNLLPEEADNFNVGLIWSPGDFQMKLDYWMVDYTNAIVKESAQGIVQRTPNDPNVLRTAGGTLTGVTTRYFNSEYIETDGVDLEMSYDTDTAAGLLSLGFNATHMMSYEIPVGQTTALAGTRTDVSGFFNWNNFARSMPETKAVISANLLNGPHAFTAFARYISAYETTRALSANAIASPLPFDQDIDSFTTLDLQYSYQVQSEDIVITAGVKNAFDEDVPLVFDDANWSYDPKHHDPRGRIFTLGLKYSL
tara:strand:- start:466 stop:3099 length:2634 start_codon:yes stop_codon:yes gene_type:complete